jgi:hypothetical protein
MPVTFTAERAEFVSATDAASYQVVTTPFTPAANSLLYAFVLGPKTTDATFDLTSVTDTGMGLTWTKQDFETWTNTQFYRLHILTALVGASPASITAITALWNQTILGTDAWIGEFAGHDPATPWKNQGVANNASGTDPTATMPVAPDAAAMSLVAAITRRNPPGWTNAGWTADMDNGISTPVCGLSVWHKAATQAFTGTSGTDALNYTTIQEIPPAPAVTTSFIPVVVGG